MPFYALPYHIGVWKGMEGHREGSGHKLEEGEILVYARALPALPALHALPAIHAVPALPYCFNRLPFIDGALQI